MIDMRLKINKILCLLVCVLRTVYCELSPDAIRSLLQSYSMSVNSSISLSKSNKDLLNSWSEEFQIKSINITTKFRLQMTRHKEHSFKRIHPNKKLIQCMDIYATDIAASEHRYIENESICLKTVNSEDKEQKSAVEQVEREIKSWRRSYKYLSHLCNINNPDNEDKAGSCLVEYIERDNYNSTLQRLMTMKMKAMSELYLRKTNSMEHLKECLKINFSSYLELVRRVMEKLNKCYGEN